MHSTERNTLLIVVFVVIFAVMFVLEARQANRISVKAHPPSTSTGEAGLLYRVPCVMQLYPARIDFREPDKQMRNL